jgi:CYTH domain-containing protein
MGVEIERKFLVPDLGFLDGVVGVPYRQGYLSADPDRTVRIRRAGEHALVTIKGRSHGASRAEFEYEIPVADADEMLALCVPPLIEKVRHRVEHAGRTFDVDVFAGANEGLVVAEVELPSEDAVVALPPWIGDEVTGDPRYFNANLVANPYRDWTEHGT